MNKTEKHALLNILNDVSCELQVRQMCKFMATDDQLFLKEIDRRIRTLLAESEMKEGLMISGQHDHYCDKCKQVKSCPLVTHCRKPIQYPCIDCIYDEATKIVKPDGEGQFYEKGKV
jgi:hypothetical protein